MTTKITIRHDGPDHHNVKVARTYVGASSQHDTTTILKAGQSYECHVYDEVRVEVTETSEPPTDAG